MATYLCSPCGQTITAEPDHLAHKIKLHAKFCSPKKPTAAQRAEEERARQAEENETGGLLRSQTYTGRKFLESLRATNPAPPTFPKSNEQIEADYLAAGESNIVCIDRSKSRGFVSGHVKPGERVSMVECFRRATDGHPGPNDDCMPVETDQPKRGA